MLADLKMPAPDGHSVGATVTSTASAARAEQFGHGFGALMRRQPAAPCRERGTCYRSAP